VDEEIILNRKLIITREITFGFQASFHFPLVPRGQFLLPTAAKGIKNAARGLGVLLTPPFVWFRDHILTIESKFGGDGEVSFWCVFSQYCWFTQGYVLFGTHHGYTGSHFGLQRGDGRARYCKSLDVAVVDITNVVCYVAFSDHLNENKELDEPYFVKFPLSPKPKAVTSSGAGYLMTLANTAFMFFPFSEKLRSYSVTTFSAAYSLA
jgi:hypothetical protein